MYYVYKELPEALASKYPNAAQYDGIYVVGRSEAMLTVPTIELEDVAALDVDGGDTKADIDAEVIESMKKRYRLLREK